MMHHLAKSAGSLVLLALWLLFPGCNALPPAGIDAASSEATDDLAEPNDNPDVSIETLAVFSDPESDFSTTDVRDVDEEIVQFDTDAKTLIWAAGGNAFDGWEVSGNLLGIQQQFQVRFGTKDGERRAYFTETGPATICDIFVENGRLRIFPTNVTVPSS